MAAPLCDPEWGRMLKNVNSAINIRPLRGHIMLKINLLKRQNIIFCFKFFIGFCTPYPLRLCGEKDKMIKIRTFAP